MKTNIPVKPESVQVMLFSDRLEVWNPGSLPPVLTLKSLLKPHGSYPKNPLVAEPLYLTKYIERIGTGISDMVDRCRTAGLLDPEFKLTDGFVITIRRKPGIAFESVGGVTLQVTPQVRKLLAVLSGEMARSELMDAMGLKDRMHFIREYILPAIESGLIEMTIPEKPKSSLQKYRQTQKGHDLQMKHKGSGTDIH